VCGGVLAKGKQCIFLIRDPMYYVYTQVGWESCCRWEKKQNKTWKAKDLMPFEKCIFRNEQPVRDANRIIFGDLNLEPT
jgi:hypothetical protein